MTTTKREWMIMIMIFTGKFLIQLLKYKNSKRELRFKPPVIKFDINADDINSVL